MLLHLSAPPDNERGPRYMQEALAAFQTAAPKQLRLAAADAYLVCAERLLADGKKDAAIAIYKALATREQVPHVRRAAMRGLSVARGEK